MLRDDARARATKAAEVIVGAATSLALVQARRQQQVDQLHSRMSYHADSTLARTLARALTPTTAPRALADAVPNHVRADYFANRTVFGRILRGEADAAILYEDDEVLCFQDIAPAATHHFLTIPKRHIEHVGCLTSDDLPLLRHMCRAAAAVAQKNGVTDIAAALTSGELAVGFHVWPFITVKHLHLHVVWPMESRSCLDRLKFPDSTWPLAGRWPFPSAEAVAQERCGLKPGGDDLLVAAGRLWRLGVPETPCFTHVFGEGSNA